MSKRPMKNRHFISLSNKSHNRNDPGTDEKQNHYVDLSHQHSWLGSFARSEHHGNYFSKFTFPSFFAFGGKRAIFYGEDVNETPMLGTSSTNSLGLGTLHFAEPKPRGTELLPWLHRMIWTIWNMHVTEALHPEAQPLLASSFAKVLSVHR